MRIASTMTGNNRITEFAGHIMAALHGYQAEWNE